MAKPKSKRREQRRLHKRKERKEAAPNRHLAERPKRRLKQLPPGLKNFTNEEMMFWLAHGVNYLASTYEEGVWDPVVEEIYDGKKITPDQLVKAVSDRFDINGEQDLDPVGQACLAWTVQDRVTVYVFSREARRAVKKSDPDCNAGAVCRQPRNPVIWKVFQDVKQQVLSRTAG